MTMRLVRNEFCEFGYHNPKEPFSDVIYPRIIDSRLRNLCDRCYNLLFSCDVDAGAIYLFDMRYILNNISIARNIYL